VGELRVKDAILDGEIVCVDAEGRLARTGAEYHRKWRWARAPPEPDFR
jgi:hypothetical protein